MGRVSFRTLIGAAEDETAESRALVEERYAALRKQVPVVYLLAAVNILALQVTAKGSVDLGLNLSTLFVGFGLVRSLQWLRPHRAISHEVMQRRLHQTTALAIILCTAVCLWCLHLLETAQPHTHMAVLLFGTVTATGVAYGLSALPVAAIAPLAVLALPLASVALQSPNPLFVGAAISLLALVVLISRLLFVHNAHFADVVRSRSAIHRERKEVERAREEAITAAATDFLTGLPNRRAFVDTLNAALDQSRNDNAFVAAVLDLDHFKNFNDTFGHGFGDEVLKIVAVRLATAVGVSGYVARLGGDEFGLLFPGLWSHEQARSMGERVLAEVNKPAVVEGRHIHIQASCGMGLSRYGNERCPTRALSDADIALYSAKSQADSPVAVFESYMEAAKRRRSEIEQALQLPAVYDELKIAFQPIVDLETGCIIAQEALARWRHENLGSVEPSEFIPIAEQLHLIGNLSEHLLQQALKEMASWPPAIRLSFNLSAVQLCTDGLAGMILNMLKEQGVTADRLQVEVTETALLVNFDQARTNLTRLREAGITIVLDDFGAGYASIGYLREIRFDLVKLDGEMLTAAAQSPEGERLLRAVIDLCRALDLTTVAEHVENESQRLLLLRLGCKLGQGFWIAPPRTPEEDRDLSSGCDSSSPETRFVVRRAA